ncbi:AlpA family transcriptional regulator [Paracoccus sp. IB05]|uniref:helix-turn-helix transcriptional regulator n=1 Tax=Paracoccus sp. IB05 TaxID=2779367 RepID=UPI0018E8ED9C|nr:helix-turn-helix domain-containing protein [Paracoccus sp. IB05]MBJ2153785.1 helix-turn-helix domain-containing protein [Paracoccus sp. IB05]
MTHTISPGAHAERYLSIPAAARVLGIPASTLRRAINRNLLPCHAPFSSRRRVLISEIRAAMLAYAALAAEGRDND